MLVFESEELMKVENAFSWKDEGGLGNRGIVIQLLSQVSLMLTTTSMYFVCLNKQRINRSPETRRQCWPDLAGIQFCQQRHIL